MSHKYPIGQLCVIVAAEGAEHFIGRQCTVTGHDILGRDMIRRDYEIEIQGEPLVQVCMERCLRPVKPGDLPDFAEEETELDEEMVA